jgi:hypothetical protein
VSVADATAITNAVNDFDTTYQVAMDPATRTKVTVAAKDDARTRIGPGPFSGLMGAREPPRPRERVALGTQAACCARRAWRAQNAPRALNGDALPSSLSVSGPP